MTAVFALRAPDIVHETIDGETVIIDLANGAYYRLETAAAWAWQTLAAGATAAELCANLAERFEAPAGEIQQAVAGFLAALGEFNLIAIVERAPGEPPPAAAPRMRAAFPGLAVHRFTDLQELLFLDPVHEVDESGWPAQAPTR